MNDTELLQQYASANDHSAFEELVRRYAGMVLGTAIRSVGNRELAEEIQQNVFILLAKKARKLSGATKPGSLASWLHRTTTLEARNFSRAESTRFRKMRELQEQPLRHEAEERTEDFGEHLDAAIDMLREAERRLVMLRFFEGYTLGEIGSIVGKSENAVQKQLARILERLGRMLERRGIVVSAAILTTSLSEFLRTEAPATAVASLASAATSSTSEPSSFLVTITMKVGLVFVLLMGASVCGIYVFDALKPRGLAHDFHCGLVDVRSDVERDALSAESRRWLGNRSFGLVADPTERAEWHFVNEEEGDLYVSPAGNYALFLKRVEVGIAPSMYFAATGNRREIAQQQIEAYKTLQDFLQEVMAAYYSGTSLEHVSSSLDEMIKEAEAGPSFLERLSPD